MEKKNFDEKPLSRSQGLCQLMQVLAGKLFAIFKDLFENVFKYVKLLILILASFSSQEKLLFLEISNKPQYILEKKPRCMSVSKDLEDELVY